MRVIVEFEESCRLTAITLHTRAMYAMAGRNCGIPRTVPEYDLLLNAESYSLAVSQT